MKQRLKILTVVVVVAGLVLPNFKQWFLPVPTQAFQDSQKIPAPQLVKDVSLAEPLSVTVANVSGQNLGCQNSSVASGNLVQNAGVVNLNQPASCFSLRVGAVSLAQTKLLVKPLAITQPRILVRQSPPLFSFPDVSRAPAPQALPIIPASTLVILTAVDLIERKFSSKILSPKNNSEQLSAVVYQLQVLRC